MGEGEDEKNSLRQISQVGEEGGRKNEVSKRVESGDDV
jgi:hypothetical protein